MDAGLIGILGKISEDNDESTRFFTEAVASCQETIKKLVVNNPILFTPYKDDQAIDLVLALWFLSLDPKHWQDINSWLVSMTHQVFQMFRLHDKYPTTISSYAELIEHPVDKTDEYMKSVTQGSILYPYISAFSATMGFEEPIRNN